jgi:Family of unknown function (DUF6152)
MRSRLLFAFAVVVCCVVAGAVRASAHHSFAAEFDEKKCGEFTGTLTAVDWQNPHAYFFIESKKADGVATKLTFQTSSLANMIRGGTPRGYFVQNMGKTVIVRACASLNGTDNRYAASWIRIPNEAIHRVGQDVEGIFGSNN